jgi:YVTN family beta-propeller protein
VVNKVSNNVSVINGTTNAVVSTVSVGTCPKEVAFDSANGYVYVTNSASNSVSVINGTTNKLVTSVTVGTRPCGVAFDSANGYVYVTNLDSKNVSVINGTTNKLVTSVTVGINPMGVTLDTFNGNVYVVNDQSGSLSIIPTIYHPVSKYTITFSESGLPSGTSWSTTFNGTTNSSTTGLITFTSINGSYSYNISSIAGYTISPLSGSVNVEGKNVTVNITFTHVKVTVSKYTITFSESGLPSGTSWSVTLNGTKESSTTDTISFSEPNGSYSYSVSNVTGYSVSTVSGSIIVSGNSYLKDVTFNATSNIKNSSSGISNIELYGIVGGTIAIGAIGVAAVLVFLWKKR